MVSGVVAIRLFTTSTPSMIKIDVAPVSAIACVVAIVNAFRYWCVGQPNNFLAAVALVCLGISRPIVTVQSGLHVGGVACDKFDAFTVASSVKPRVYWVGSEVLVVAETKWLHLFAINFNSAPHRQAIRWPGNTVLCIPLVHGSYPAVMNCCAFSRENACW